MMSWRLLLAAPSEDSGSETLTLAHLPPGVQGCTLGRDHHRLTLGICLPRVRFPDSSILYSENSIIPTWPVLPWGRGEAGETRRNMSWGHSKPQPCPQVARQGLNCGHAG